MNTNRKYNRRSSKNRNATVRTNKKRRPRRRTNIRRKRTNKKLYRGGAAKTPLSEINEVSEGDSIEDLKTDNQVKQKKYESFKKTVESPIKVLKDAFNELMNYNP